MSALITRGLGVSPYHLVIRAFSPGGASLPPDVLAAIVQDFDGSVMPSLIPGGMYSTQAGDGATLPYALVTKKGGSIERRTSTSQYLRFSLNVRVYAADEDTAGNLCESLAAYMQGKGYAFQGGNTALLVREKPKLYGREKTGSFGRARGRGGAEPWWCEQQFLMREITAV